MATMVCDSQFIETTWPRMASPHLKLPPPFQFSFNSSKSLPQCDHHQPNHILLNVLPLPKNESKSPMPTEDSESATYVHPRSRSTTLTDASLALCTENLGNETGADFVKDDIFFSDLKIDRSVTRKRAKSQSKSKSSTNNNNQFPPPLTTIAGVDSIRVRSYREDGRLIMEAVKTPARLSYFHVERSNGRLRLTILKSTTPEFESVEQSTEKVEEEDDEEEETSNDDVRLVGENGNYEEDLGRKVKGNGNLGGAEIEKKKLQRPCRCNEAGENNNLGKIKNNSEMLLLTRKPLISHLGLLYFLIIINIINMKININDDF